VIKKFFYGIEANGWTSLIASVFISLGLLMSSIGVLAIYISKIHNETKKEPFVVVKKIVK
jgi:putative glycosyltransferase